MKNIFMTEEEIVKFQRKVEEHLVSYNGINDEFKKWFRSLTDNVKNDFMYNFFSNRNINECLSLFKYSYYVCTINTTTIGVLIEKLIYHNDLNILLDIISNYSLGPDGFIRIADAICETGSMEHIFPLFELLTKNSVYLPGFYAILKSRDMNYINKLVEKLMKKPYIVKQDELEALVDTLLKIDDPYTIDTLYTVTNKILRTDISRCIKIDNIKYVLEKSNSFLRVGKKKDLENIVLQSKDVHQIINLVHRESLAKQEIDYDRVINSIVNNGIFDCENNENILGHVMGMMRHKEFPVSSYRILEKYLLAMHMELIPEYASLNNKTNYKYILEEMNNKHASKEQIKDYKNKIKKSNNLFRKIIDSLTYNNYKSK